MKDAGVLSAAKSNRPTRTQNLLDLVPSKRMRTGDAFETAFKKAIRKTKAKPEQADLQCVRRSRSRRESGFRGNEPDDIRASRKTDDIGCGLRAVMGSVTHASAVPAEAASQTPLSTALPADDAALSAQKAVAVFNEHAPMALQQEGLPTNVPCAMVIEQVAGDELFLGLAPDGVRQFTAANQGFLAERIFSDQPAATLAWGASAETAGDAGENAALKAFLFGKATENPQATQIAMSSAHMAAPGKEGLVLLTAQMEAHEPAHFDSAVANMSAETAVTMAARPSHAVDISQPIGQAQGSHEMLFDQVVRSVRLVQEAGATELEVRLKPEHLGKMSIRIVADEHEMHIQIKAENEVVRQVMQDNLARLEHRLAEKGVAFNQLSVSGDAGWAPKKEPEHAFDARGNGSEAAAESPVEVAEPAPLQATGVIDYLA